MSEEKDSEAFRADVARALAGIGRSLEVMQANLFITRSLIDLLDKGNYLPIAEVRDCARNLAASANLSSDAMSDIRQILGENGLEIPSVLQ